MERTNKQTSRHTILCDSFTQYDKVYLDGNLLQADRMATILVTPIRLSHVSLIRITNCAAFNEFGISLHAYVCNDTHS